MKIQNKYLLSKVMLLKNADNPNFKIYLSPSDGVYIFPELEQLIEENQKLIFKESELSRNNRVTVINDNLPFKGPITIIKSDIDYVVGNIIFIQINNKKILLVGEKNSKDSNKMKTLFNVDEVIVLPKQSKTSEFYHLDLLMTPHNR